MFVSVLVFVRDRFYFSVAIFRFFFVFFAFFILLSRVCFSIGVVFGFFFDCFFLDCGL